MQVFLDLRSAHLTKIVIRFVYHPLDNLRKHDRTKLNRLEWK